MFSRVPPHTINQGYVCRSPGNDIIAMTVWLIEQRDHYDPGERQIEGVDFVDAMRACPEGVDIATRLKLAQQLLA